MRECKDTWRQARRRRRGRSASRKKRRDQNPTGRQFQRIFSSRDRESEVFGVWSGPTRATESNSACLLKAPERSKKLTNHPLSQVRRSSCINIAQSASGTGQQWAPIGTKRLWSEMWEYHEFVMSKVLRKQQDAHDRPFRAIIQANQETRVGSQLYMRKTQTTSLMCAISDTTKNRCHLRQQFHAAAAPANFINTGGQKHSETTTKDVGKSRNWSIWPTDQKNFERTLSNYSDQSGK